MKSFIFDFGFELEIFIEIKIDYFNFKKLK